jgi:hypothetical protein
MNPDVVRWELHRTWVVDFTLKPGKRHIYAKWRFYLDEDTWAVLSYETFDAHGNRFKVGYGYQAPSYEVPAPSVAFFNAYNMISGAYHEMSRPGEGSGYLKHVNVRPERD